LLVKQVTGIVTTVKNVKTETTNGKTIPARAPFRKWREKIPTK
jgi:hypothetical protein